MFSRAFSVKESLMHRTDSWIVLLNSFKNALDVYIRDIHGVSMTRSINPYATLTGVAADITGIMKVLFGCYFSIWSSLHLQQTFPYFYSGKILTIAPPLQTALNCNISINCQLYGHGSLDE